MRLDFCVACGRKGDLHDHHVVPRGLDGPDIETNVITLCGGCHYRLHGMDPHWIELTNVGRKRAMANGVKFGRRRKLNSVLKPSSGAMPAKRWQRSPRAMVCICR